MAKISFGGCSGIYVVISVQFALEMCVAAWNRQKVNKTPILAFKVINFDANQKPLYDFLLVINSNLSPISHCFWDTATYWLKLHIFLTPLSFSALTQGDLSNF